jgi:hypothetical protein
MRLVRITALAAIEPPGSKRTAAARNVCLRVNAIREDLAKARADR